MPQYSTGLWNNGAFVVKAKGSQDAPGLLDGSRNINIVGQFSDPINSGNPAFSNDFDLDQIELGYNSGAQPQIEAPSFFSPRYWFPGLETIYESNRESGRIESSRVSWFPPSRWSRPATPSQVVKPVVPARPVTISQQKLEVVKETATSTSSFRANRENSLSTTLGGVEASSEPRSSDEGVIVKRDIFERLGLPRLSMPRVSLRQSRAFVPMKDPVLVTGQKEYSVLNSRVFVGVLILLLLIAAAAGSAVGVLSATTQGSSGTNEVGNSTLSPTGAPILPPSPPPVTVPSPAATLSPAVALATGAPSTRSPTTRTPTTRPPTSSPSIATAAPTTRSPTLATQSPSFATQAPSPPPTDIPTSSPSSEVIIDVTPSPTKKGGKPI